MLKCSMQFAFYEGKHSLLPKLINSGFIQGGKKKKSEIMKLKGGVKIALKYVEHTFQG